MINHPPRHLMFPILLLSKYKQCHSSRPTHLTKMLVSNQSWRLAEVAVISQLCLCLAFLVSLWSCDADVFSVIAGLHSGLIN